MTDQGLGVEPPNAEGFRGLEPPAGGRFFVFLEKKAVLIPLAHISHMPRAI